MSRKMTDKVNVYVEVGSRRTFVAALDWPGWCRAGRDEAAALQTLHKYGPRYGCILRPARLGFQAPKDISAFVAVERLQGNATTDFGAPDIAPAGDAQPLDDAELRRLQAILETLQAAVRGEVAARGPRGGRRWSPRYFVRREAWHVLDHIWEIEDRSGMQVQV